MEKFTNPLENIKVASPCPADWNEMIGDNRKRFCSQCRLNVFNLSGMTRQEAGNLLLNSEGNICVRYFKRADGTILTKDCPVGWQALKRHISRTLTAIASLIFGALGGIGSSEFVNKTDADKYFAEYLMPKLEKVTIQDEDPEIEIKKPIVIEQKSDLELPLMVLGRAENIRKLEDEPVVLWIE